MINKKYRCLILLSGMAIALGWQSRTNAQQLPSAPVPIVPSSPPGEQTAQTPQSSPLGLPPPLPGVLNLSGPPPIRSAAVVPPPPGLVPYQDNNGPLLRGDPLLDRPGVADPGWFFGLEFDIVATHIKNRLQAPVTLAGFSPDLVHLPTAELDVTGAPQIELGYRMPEGWGEFVLSYRCLVTEGSETILDFDPAGDGFLKSHLDMQVIDLDYASREFSLLPHWDMKWRVGARFATVFFDSQADGIFLEQRTTNHFVGAGPHVGLDVRRSFDWPGLGFYARLDGATVIGKVHQSFEEIFFFPDGSVSGGAASDCSTKAVPVVSLRTGLTWTPGRLRTTRYALGYEIEQWWDLGNVGSSHAEITSQGFFFRGEFRF